MRKGWLFRKSIDTTDARSLSTVLRGRRFQLFQRLFDSTPKPVRILDVGGTPEFWEMMGFSERTDAEITLLNLVELKRSSRRFTYIVGDARNLGMFSDYQFDVVFSNSVIEHVGGYLDQRKMVDEVKRVGKRYFVQTPNKHFPIEPHFFFPFFQFLPISVRAWLLNHVDLRWHKRMPNYQEAKREVEAVRLLTEDEFMRLFPEAVLYKERLLGLTKSMTAYHGWDVV